MNPTEFHLRQNWGDSNEGGFALCALVGIIAVLGITVMVFNFMARRELKDSIIYVEKVKEQMAASAGINYGVWALREQGDAVPEDTALEVAGLDVEVEVEADERDASMRRIKSACSGTGSEAVVRVTPHSVELLYLRTD